MAPSACGTPSPRLYATGPFANMKQRKQRRPGQVSPSLDESVLTSDSLEPRDEDSGFGSSVSPILLATTSAPPIRLRATGPSRTAPRRRISPKKTVCHDSSRVRDVFDRISSPSRLSRRPRQVSWVDPASVHLTSARKPKRAACGGPTHQGWIPNVVSAGASVVRAT
jgi:hypothetical protein